MRRLRTGAAVDFTGPLRTARNTLVPFHSPGRRAINSNGLWHMKSMALLRHLRQIASANVAGAVTLWQVSRICTLVSTYHYCGIVAPARVFHQNSPPSNQLDRHPQPQLVGGLSITAIQPPLDS
jgi:hypothetical protein